MQVQASHSYQMPALFPPTCQGTLQTDCCSCIGHWWHEVPCEDPTGPQWGLAQGHSAHVNRLSTPSMTD